MKKILIILIAIFVLLPQAGQADVIMEGQHGVASCHKFINLNDFPDYEFYYGPTYVSAKTLESIEADQCLKYYKLVSPKIYAIKKNDVAKAEAELEKLGELTLADIINNKYMIKSDLVLESIPNTVSDTNPLIGVEVQYKIISVGNKVVAEKYKQIKKYKGDRVEEEMFDTAKVQKTGVTNFLNFWYYYIPILAGLGLVIVFFKKYLIK